MIDLMALGNTLLVFVPAMVSPGPDFLLVSSIAIARGRGEGIKSGAGIATACAIHTALCLIGLAAIFAANDMIAKAAGLIGGMYLADIGRKIWLSSLQKNEPEASSVLPSSQANSYGMNAYLAGLTNGVTNPKALAFFTSIFAGALSSDSSVETMVAIEIVLPALAVIWFTLTSVVLTVPRFHQRFIQHQVVMDRVVGTVLGVYGIKMIVGVVLSFLQV